MRLLLQRVREGRVAIEGKTVASIGTGLVVLVGFGPDDTAALRRSRVWSTLIEKMIGLRIFPDEEGKMNRGIEDFGGEVILVSQFTLYADCRKGNRPSFTDAGAPDHANRLYEYFMERCKMHVEKVAHGEFGADMKVELLNDGPFTLMLESEQLFK